MNRGISLVALCALLYAPSLGGTFHYDDHHSIVQNPHIRSLGNIPAFFVEPDLFSADPEKSMYRPLLLVSYALNYALGEYDGLVYHLTNVLIHGLCCVLVALLAEGLVGIVRAGWVAGVIFAVHPLAGEPIHYISSRSESLAGLFYLLVLACGGGFVRGGRGVAVAAYGAALLVKSIAFGAPMVLLLFDYIRDRLSSVRSYLPFAGVAVLYLGIIYQNRFVGDSLAAPVRDMAVQLYTQAKAPAYYLYLAFVPVKLNVQHQFFESQSVGEPAVWLGLLLILSLIFLMWRGRKTLPASMLLWALVVLVPTFLMPLNMLVNERRLYVPLAAFAIALAWGWQRRPAAWSLGVVALVMLGGLSAQRTAVWADELTLWRDAAQKAPYMHAVQNNLGKALQEAGNTDEAIKAYKLAVQIDPRHGDAYNNLATIYHLQGERMRGYGDVAGGDAALRRAVDWYIRALKAYPTYEEIHQNAAAAYALLGDVQAALAHYERALELNGARGEIWNNYGQLLYEQGALARAEAAFLRTVQLMPDRPEAHNNLGNVYADMGDWQRSIAAYEQALQHADTERDAIELNLIGSLRQGGEWDRARSMLGVHIAEDSQSTVWPYQLALLERAAGNVRAAEQVLAAAAERVEFSGRGLVLRAELLSELGEFGEAIVQFEEAQRAGADRARVLYGLGEAYMLAGERKPALETLRAFMAVWPRADERQQRVERWIARLEGAP